MNTTLDRMNRNIATPQSTQGRRGAAWIPILALAILAIAAAVVVPFYLRDAWSESAQSEMERDVIARLLGRDSQIDGVVTFRDEDGDLLVDPPTDEDVVAPDEFVFSYVASKDEAALEQAWQEVTAQLSEKLGKPVRYQHFSDTKKQLQALGKGELHIIGLSTGTVPLAVKGFGFIPVCTFGREDGSFGYTMQIIVPGDSPVSAPQELRGKRVYFTRPTSNSGFKAALHQLATEHQLFPERDYDWPFSLGHETSIKGVAAGEYEAAPIASDILQRILAQGDIAEDEGQEHLRIG